MREHAINDTRQGARIQRAIALCHSKIGKTKCERCRSRVATYITRGQALCATCTPTNRTVTEAARRLAAVTR